MPTSTRRTPLWIPALLVTVGSLALWSDVAGESQQFSAILRIPYPGGAVGTGGQDAALVGIPESLSHETGVTRKCQ